MLRQLSGREHRVLSAVAIAMDEHIEVALSLSTVRFAALSEEILINVTPQETRVAVMQLGVVQDMYIERSGSRGIVSNVYFGKVMRVLPGMQSAFIDIGLERSAFLHVADIWENSSNGDPAKPIEKAPSAGKP